MKLNEFWVQLFGSEDSKLELEQLDKWKIDGELNANKLQEMVALNKESNHLNSYKTYDVEAAFANTMSNIDSEPTQKTIFPTYLFIIIGILLLTIAGISYNMFTSQNENPVQIATTFETYSKTDGSEFVIKTGSLFESNESANQYKLIGEAFFDIEKQSNPLLIETAHGMIKVIGTSFNVLTSDEYTEIYMFDGIIEFTDSKGVKTSVKKGQRIISNNTQNILTEDISSQVYTYWRTEVLNYNDIPLSNVLGDLNRLYDQSYNNSSTEYNGVNITANFYQSSLEEIITELEVITKLELK